ncbi:hypothetical protein ACFLQZ_01545 [Acidobacteriota bacterium]
MTKHGRTLFILTIFVFGSLLLTSFSIPAFSSELSIISRIDSNCQRTQGHFQVPLNTFAQNFNIRQLYQGTGCETGGPINFRKFAIKNIESDKVVYEYNETRGEAPNESPVRLNQLILSPGNYALSVAGGADAVCEIHFELGEEPSFVSDTKTLNSWIDNECMQHCADFVVQSPLFAQKFRMRELSQGTSCQTGRPIRSRSFAILNAETRESVYGFRQYSGEDPSQNPCDLDELILPPGKYSMCVGGGVDAKCILSYELADRPDVELPTSSLQVRSQIDSQCIQHCGRFEIPDLFSARGFRIIRLNPGTHCQTGISEQRRSFSIMHEETNETLYRFSQIREREPVEQPTAIDSLCLPPGNYRLCVGGGEDAICIIEYMLSSQLCSSEQQPEYVWIEVCKISGDLPNQWCPLKVKRKFVKGQEPTKECENCKIISQEDEQKVKDEMKVANDIDDVIELIGNIKEELDDFEQELRFVSSFEQVEQAQLKLQQLRDKLNQLKDKRRSIRNFADSKEIDITDAGAGEEWSQMALDFDWIENRIDLLESHLDKLEQAFTQDPSVLEWLNYAKNFAYQHGVDFNLSQLESEMNQNIHNRTPKESFYIHLFEKWVSCLIEDKKRRSNCSISGGVDSSVVIKGTERLRYVYHITENCPNQNPNRQEGKGEVSFAQLEQWVRDSCRN